MKLGWNGQKNCMFKSLFVGGFVPCYVLNWSLLFRYMIHLIWLVLLASNTIPTFLSWNKLSGITGDFSIASMLINLPFELFFVLTWFWLFVGLYQLYMQSLARRCLSIWHSGLISIRMTYNVGLSCIEVQICRHLY